MKKMLLSAVVAVAISMACFLQSVEASPMSMSYDITDLGAGLYDYEFSLTLDNNDTSWVVGQSWDWLIFGDVKFGEVSPLSDFVGDAADLPVGPWDNYSYSSGSHNGPTLVNFEGGWKPVVLNETLNWSGTSHNFVGQGEMFFSTLQNYGVNGFVGWPDGDDHNVYGSNGAYYQLANLGKVTSPVITPEPVSMVLFGVGGAAMAALGRRKKV